MTIKAAVQNWKTTVSGIITFVLSIPLVLSSLEDYANHKPVDWRNVLIAGALWAISHGFIQAKDGTTHSTAQQVQAATIEAK